MSRQEAAGSACKLSQPVPKRLMLLLQSSQCPCMSGLQFCTSRWRLLLPLPPRACAGPPARPSVRGRLTSTAVIVSSDMPKGILAHHLSSSMYLWHPQLASNTGQLLLPPALLMAVLPLHKGQQYTAMLRCAAARTAGVHAGQLQQQRCPQQPCSICQTDAAAF